MTSKILLQRGKGYRVESGHPWIYGNEIDKTEGSPVDGSIVDVFNFKQKFIGRGYYNSRSQITVRLLTRNVAETIDDTFFSTK